ncbi:hypothetical protein I3A86_25565 [Salmonella enterica]|nr:hypothetical protein [Salmonella enterica]
MRHTARGRQSLRETERKMASFHDDLYASLTRLEHTAERLRRRTILFALWGVVMVAAIVVRIIAGVQWP